MSAAFVAADLRLRPPAPLEWGQQAFRFYDTAGFDPRTKPFGISFDPAKMMAQVTWDPKTDGFVGQLDFNSDLSFRSWKDMVLGRRAVAIASGAGADCKDRGAADWEGQYACT